MLHIEGLNSFFFLVAAANHLNMVCTVDDTKWNELVAPAPMGIAVMSQLLICSSLVTDFRIDQIDKTHIPLIKHPSSFRTTLVQIVNEAYNAFMQAHTNMEKIQLQVVQVPHYVTDCVKNIKSNNKAAIENFVPRRLERIKEAADDGLKLSTEVSEAFHLLSQLIQQVRLAISASQGAKEQEIENLIKARIGEDNLRRTELKKKEQAILEMEMENARKTAQDSKAYLNNVRKRRFRSYLFFETKEESIKFATEMVGEAEKDLEKAKQDSMEAEEEMKKICNECIKSLENMQVNVKEDIQTDRMIQILKEGTKLLGELQDKWTGMTRYFQSINSFIEKVMNKKYIDFTNDAKDAQTDTYLIDLMKDTITDSLESSIKSHRTAATYVKVSNSYIMEPLRNMHVMLSIEPDELQQAQKELIDSCKKASAGIQIMFIEDREQTIREMENAIQSSDTVQSIEN